MNKRENKCTEENTSKEDENMDVIVERKGYKRLDFGKLNFSDKELSSKDTLSDIIPIQWSEDILNGGRKVVIKRTKDK